MSQQINLFNPLFLKQKKHFSAVTIAQAVCVLLLALGGFYAFALYQVDGLERQASDITKQQQQQQERLARVTAQLGGAKADPLEQELKTALDSLAARQALAASLGSASLGSRAGYSEYMRALARQAVSGLWLTGFRINETGDEVALTGRAQYADLVPVYIRKLGMDPAMRGRTFDGLVLSEVTQQVSMGDPVRGIPPLSAQVVQFSIGTTHAAIEAMRQDPAPDAAAAMPTSLDGMLQGAVKAAEAKK